MTADTPPVEHERVEYGSTKVLQRRQFAADDICELFRVAPDLVKVEPGHVMTRSKYERIKEQS